MLRVTGRVYVQETGEGRPDLHVKAVDKDLIFDDVVGTAVTDRDGRFEITYERRDFAELFDKKPDLYIVVRNPKTGRIVHSSEESVRWDAGPDETFDVPIPQSALDDASGAPRPPYGPEYGTVRIDLSAGGGLPEEMTLFFSEHRSQGRRQHRITARTGCDVTVDLPSGEYTMQLLVRGFETVRGLVEVDPKRPVTVDALLKPRTKRLRTFEERLARYGVDARQTEIVDLEVPTETTLALNHERDVDKRGFRMLRANTIAQAREWVGGGDAQYGHDRPVFGPPTDRKLLARLLDDDINLRELGADEVKAVTAIAREYVQGNATSVLRYEPLLNRAITETVQDALTRFPFFFYRVVTIGPGATLEVGNGSAIFTCDELRIHTTGKLKPVANVTIEIGTYTEFQ